MPHDKKLYDKMRPPKYKGNATEVLFHVTVMSLDTIDESSMTYTCDVFFAQSWKDNRLRLPDNMTSEYRLLPIEWLTQIWRPDSFFKNAKDVTFQTMTIPNHYIWLWKDKTILYMVKLTLVLSCPMHFKNYPHDTQTCNLEIESISHTTDDLIFTWDPAMPLDVDKGIELPQLELISTKHDDCTTVYSTGKFTCLEVVFKFKRRLGYYLFHTYVPTCLIVIMSWISFWIKPEAVPARVTLGVTSLLTLSTQHANSQKSLPPVSYIKAIDVFMSGCTVFVFLSLMEYALVNIVMGDIADIEKKKSMGISNLILGSTKAGGAPPTAQVSSLHLRRKNGSVEDLEGPVTYNHDEGVLTNQRDVFSSMPSLVGHRATIGPTTGPLSVGGLLTADGTSLLGQQATLVKQHTCGGGHGIGGNNNSSNNRNSKSGHNHSSSSSHHHHHHHHHTSSSPPSNTIPLNHLDKRRDSELFYSASQYNSGGGGTGMTKSEAQAAAAAATAAAMQGQSPGQETTYFMNRDGLMETVTTDNATGAIRRGDGTGAGSGMGSDFAAATGNCVNSASGLGLMSAAGGGQEIPMVGSPGFGPGPANGNGKNGGGGGGQGGGSDDGCPGGGGGGGGATNLNNNSSVISQQGIKNLVHDVQIKRQREIRDMMKKKREKAVLVDRISRWLFPTSFILLNIVYWALFGDHKLWT